MIRPICFTVVSALAWLPAAGVGQGMSPQERSSWVDSTHVTGLAKKVVPEPPPAPVPDHQTPGTVAELLAAMAGAEIYLDVYRPPLLPSYVRVVVRPDAAEVQYADDFTAGPASGWLTACQMTALHPNCSTRGIPYPDRSAIGDFTVTPVGIGWDYIPDTRAECTGYGLDDGPRGSVAGSGQADYSYDDWRQRRGFFSNHEGRGMSGQFFQNAWYTPTQCF